MIRFLPAAAIVAAAAFGFRAGEADEEDRERDDHDPDGDDGLPVGGH